MVENAKGAFALRYGGADQLKMVEEYYRLNRARDFAEWQKALAIQGVPATNFALWRCGRQHRLFLQCELPQPEAGL